MEDIRERIREIIELEQQTQYSFSVITKINKSTLSHVLTGRNSPSAQVLQQILEAYPHYRAEWLMKGELPKTKEGYQESLQIEKCVPLFQNNAQSAFARSDHSESIEQKEATRSNPVPPKATSTPSPQKTSQERRIEKIVVFYTDKTFDVYEDFPTSI